uniref:4-coumarate--CoA ligase 1-like isoform X2 n=1 Tax=Styela clava TaxID=7725 RepID=UPI001939A4A8|nr:4-coumarate--CoA ligase 1-like isoform X2 [Styela clava]
MPVKSPHGILDIPEVPLSDFFLSRIKEYGDETAMIDNTVEGKQLTFRQLYKQIQSCGRFIQKQGIHKGDVVGLIVPNCLEYVIAMMGVISCGAVISPCNPSYKEGEMQHIFKITEPKILIVSDKTIDVVKRVVEKSKSIRKIIVIGKSDEFETWDEGIAANEKEQALVLNFEISAKDDLAILPYSSGTTGMPKCVMHTHYSMIATLLTCWYNNDYKKGETFYNERPMFHAGGYLFVLMSLQGGLRVVMDREFDVERTLAAIQNYQVNHFIMVPPIMLEMSQTDLNKKYDTSSWKTSLTGGASIPTSIMKAVSERFNINMFPGYGMTEFTPMSINDNVQSFADSDGSICSNVEMMIVDSNTGMELKSGEDGEILVKGPQMTKGYYRNREATEQTINKNGFLHTGDIGHIQNNMVYVVGRLKEVIKYKTFQVTPAEIENILLRHPGVSDAGVVGIPDQLCGELPKALVVRKLSSVNSDELLELIKRELVDYKQLRGGIQFVDKIPKSKMGKIDRTELKKNGYNELTTNCEGIQIVAEIL